MTTPAEEPLFDHHDQLAALHGVHSLGARLKAVHEALRGKFSFVDRISVVSYDPGTDLLKTFIDSSAGDKPLFRYEAPLAECGSLLRILETGRPRVVNNLEVFGASRHEHTRSILSQGYRSSYTMPVYFNSVFWGFLFFNSYTPDVFTSHALHTLDVFGHLVGLLVTSELMATRILAAAMRTAHSMVHFRDPETGGHIERMSHYARLIARDLAARYKHEFDDATIEQILEFSPLHDIGKIAVPDRILRKPGPLSPEEREEMKVHTTRGLEMIDAIVRNFGLQNFQGIDILRHIAESHHESVDGSGYPRGLKGDQIPIEARIVAVADVFDALTSARPYKDVWSNAEAFAMIRKLARTQLDEDCVESLCRNALQVVEIQKRFRDAEATAGEPPAGKT